MSRGSGFAGDPFGLSLNATFLTTGLRVAVCCAVGFGGCALMSSNE